MMPAWDWSEDLLQLANFALGCGCLSWGGCNHDGSGSLWFKLPIREARERVSWTSRWRDCSRILIWSWFRDAILL